ncbi:3,4-dihydroxy-2-butanone 4-phosphate synthase [Hyphomicrobium sulfonivorans]|uniref:3,4-dihydroxy-2-butanone 4-phosphate synthase n=2 Tax=Hyphomicrobium sulfonivorans TaxID=121290 RepID=A0A109BP95_HYPSL|nr:3,4-dihydroxy-2-butanone 4-phosphate synthase [Hyphomicrobium sulfonivorans]
MTNSAGEHAISEGRSCLSPISEILEDMRNGRMVVLVDAEDRENEGDLVIPAQMATPDAVNFMARYGRGLICLTLTGARARELQLQAMVGTNRSRNRTAFTQSIEAREGISTGISAADRARTIATAIDPTRGADDIVSPGHVFPLVAREGGVLIRAGHTEASVDLARLAGLYPAAVICEIMNDDGTMARLPDLVPFAQRHGLKIGAIEELIAHRLRNEHLVRAAGKTSVDTTAGRFDLHIYETTVEPSEHLALVKGDISGPEPVLVRVHAVNVLGDVVGVAQADGHVLNSLRMVEQAGRGVVVLIRDLRSNSLSEWVKARGQPKAVQQGAKERRQVEIGVGSQILRDLGVRDMVLLSNSPAHVYVGLEGFGLRVVETRGIE